jgi:hypothetical protein
MVACVDYNIVPNCYKTDPISKLIATWDELQYEIQISKLTTTVEALRREVRQKRYNSPSNSTFSTYHHFSGYSQRSQRIGKFLTCEICGSIGHTDFECQVGMTYFQELESKIFYMINF